MENEASPGQPTPQRLAYDSAADELLYGGAAGGGKTDLLLGLALTRHRRSILFRREGTQLRAAEDRLAEILGARTGFRAASQCWHLPGDRLLEFGHCQHPGDERKYQGRPHDLKAFDELTHFTESQYRFLATWLRTTRPGQRTRIVAASNPPTAGEGEWVIRHWAPWLDPGHGDPAAPGELRWFAMLDGEEVARPDGAAFTWRGEEVRPRSRSFVPSGVDDNPYLDGGYKAVLQALPEPLRGRMLKGDWQAGLADHPWQVIPGAWVRAAQERWRAGAAPPGGRRSPRAAMTALGVDVAQGGDDETVLTPRFGMRCGEQIVRPGRETPDGAAVVALVATALRDGAQVNIDCTGGWGGAAYEQLRTLGVPCLRLVMSEASEARDRSGSLGFVNRRAELYWRCREWLDPANGHDAALPPDPLLRADLCAARWKVVRGQAGRGGRIQIDDKQAQARRLGRSPDRGDSLVYALEDGRPRGATGGAGLRPRGHDAAVMTSPFA